MRKSGFLFFSGIILAFLFFVDWYVFQGFQTLTRGLSLSHEMNSFYWFFFFSLSVAVLFSFYFARLAGDGFTRSSRIVVHIFFILFVAKLVFVAVLFGEDIYRVVVAMVYSFQESTLGMVLPERQKLISQAGIVLAAIPFLSLIYGVAKGKHQYKVHRHTIYFDDLPEAFDGFTITQLSDIHAGSFSDARAVQKGIDLVVQQNSDLFVFTGDLVNNKASEVEPWLDHFRQITAPYGKFAILGNHDYGDYIPWNSQEEKIQNLGALKDHHKVLGHRLLLDESITIEKEGDQIVLLGVENWGKGFGKRGDLGRALDRVHKEAFKILLSHDPSHWDEEVKHHPAKIHLTLSGHTHGMQFGFEMPGLRWSPVKYRYPNWAGLVEFGERYLYVNRGFGFIGFEGRVGIWPEITVIELKRSKASELS